MGNRSRYREKSKYRYPLNNFGSLFALIMLLLILYTVILAPLIDSLGGMGEIITDLVELFPFGEVSYRLAIEIINAVAGQGVNYASIHGVFSFSYVMQELLEGIFTVIIYEALTLALTKLMQLDDPDVRGIWNSLKRMVLSVGVAILAACFAPALINSIFSNMGSLSNGWKTAISSLMSIILMGGGISFFLFLYSLTFGTALGYVLLKFLAIGALRLTGSYICIFIFCLGIKNGMFSLIFAGSSGLLGLTLVLAGIELMISSAFNID